MSEKDKHDQLVQQADALYSTAKQVTALRDTFNCNTEGYNNLSDALEKILDTFDHVQGRLGRQVALASPRLNG